MAINVEQEKRQVNWIGIILTIIIVGVLFAGGYILFFQKPELIEVVVPGKLEGLSQISQLNFTPEQLLESPEFQLLKQYGVEVTPPQPGRSNPFRPY